MINYNIRTLPGKIDDTRILFENSHADCVGLTESWLTTMHKDDTFILEGYNFCRLDRDLTLPGADDD